MTGGVEVVHTWGPEMMDAGMRRCDQILSSSGAGRAWRALRGVRPFHVRQLAEVAARQWWLASPSSARVAWTHERWWTLLDGDLR